jgi:Uncharacterized protein conserved in bacteria (DUF2147)
LRQTCRKLIRQSRTFAAHTAEPCGTWLRPSTGTQVRFYDCGGKLCGRISAVKDQARKKSDRRRRFAVA